MLHSKEFETLKDLVLILQSLASVGILIRIHYEGEYLFMPSEFLKDVDISTLIKMVEIKKNKVYLVITL